MSGITVAPAALIVLLVCLWFWYLSQGGSANEAAWKAFSNVAVLVVIIVMIAVLNLYISPIGHGLLRVSDETAQPHSQGSDWMDISKRLTDQAKIARDPKVKRFFVLRALGYGLAACDSDPDLVGCFKLRRKVNSSKLTDAERVEVRGDAMGLEGKSPDNP